MTKRSRWCVGWALVGALVAPAAAGPGAPYDLDIRSPSPSRVLETAATVTERVELANRGVVGWSSELGFSLAYHWLDSDGEVVVWDGLRTPLPAPVEPGQTRWIDATLLAPERAGDYRLVWDVVQEGVLWISDLDPTPVAARPVTVVASHAFSLLEIATPRVLRRGGGRPAEAVIRNDGTRTWPGDGSVALAYHWRRPDGEIVEWEGRRAAITRRVAPGEAVMLETVVTAPPESGRLELEWDMVEDGVCWFSSRDDTPEPAVAVLVLPAVWIGPILWTMLVALASMLALVRFRSSRPVAGAWPIADVVWCGSALIVKQWWVVAASGAGLTASGWCLVVGGAALLGLVLLLLPARIRPWASWTAAAATTLLLYADLVHLRFFGDLVSMAALAAVRQLGQVEASVRSLIEPGDLWFWADLLVALPLAWLVSARRRGAVRPRRAAAAAALLAVVTMVAGVTLIQRSRVPLRQVFQATDLARRVGVLDLHLGDVAGTALRAVLRRPLDDDDRDRVAAYFERRRPTRAGTGPWFGAARGRNLVMVQVESLQAFVIGTRVGGREVTPFLNRLAAEGLHFANVTDQTEEGRSSDAELATQVSLLPPDRGAAAFLFADNRYTGLASILAERGYRTLSAVAFDGSFWNRRTTHRAYGYERSLFAEDFEAGERIGWGLNDRDFLAQSAARLAALPEPWCGYLLTLSLHHPFEGFPAEHRVLDVGAWEGTPFGNYLHTMHYFDRAFEDFVGALDRSGVADRTVIALWGDHDAGFEWTPEIAAAIGAPHDAVGWYTSQRVPLVLRVPGATSAGVDLGVPAGHVDVAPTLLALLGVDPGPYLFVGRNLLGTPGDGPVVGEYRCWRDDRHLYLRHGPELTDGRCVELATMREVAPAACADGFEAARLELEMSRLVLEHDLQRALLDGP